MSPTLLTIFGIFFFGFILLDMFILNRRAHAPTLRESIGWTMFWVLAAGVFGLLIWRESPASAVEFYSVFLTEKMLSLDNLFVILLIFNYFAIDEKYQHKVLMWGIWGAIVMRAIFIGLGSTIVNNFSFVLYIFGAVLVWSGIKLLRENDEHDADMDKNRFLRFLRKYIPLASGDHGANFFTRHNGKLMATTLFLSLLMVEITDLIFAIDSIPASFSISQNAYIIFTANMFAVMGLRALFFVIEYILEKFHLLSKAIALILVFIGGKLFLGIIHVHISSLASLLVIVGILATAIILSPYIPNSKHQKRIESDYK
jgi:tellurite resistance protein TerC